MGLDLSTAGKALGEYNQWTDKFNQSVSSTKQNKTIPQNYSANSQEDSISNVRNNLGFSDIEFSFPVTDKSNSIRLPAFLTSHSDSFSPQWNPQTVYGRADPIPIYRNTTRTISIGFKIPNQSIEDASANFNSLGVLVKNLYPAYKSFGSANLFGAFRDALSGLSPNQSIVGAPLMRVKFANLICNSEVPDLGLLGYATGLNITTDVQNGFLISNGDGENDNLLFPRFVNFSLTLNVLHEHKVGWGTSGNWLGRNKQNYPFTVGKDGSLSTEAVNVMGALMSGDPSAGIRAVFGS